MNKKEIAGLLFGAILLTGVLSWAFTAGIILGGTLTEAPSDFSPLHDSVQGPMIMKPAGFPPFVNYLSWVGTPEGVISATRPDGGYWARRLRERGGDGWLRIGDATYAMEANEVFGDERIAMMRQWAGGRSIDQPLYPGSEPLRDWEVFFWKPR